MFAPICRTGKTYLKQGKSSYDGFLVYQIKLPFLKNYHWTGRTIPQPPVFWYRLGGPHFVSSGVSTQKLTLRVALSGGIRMTLMWRWHQPKCGTWTRLSPPGGGGVERKVNWIFRRFGLLLKEQLIFQEAYRECFIFKES